MKNSVTVEELNAAALLLTGMQLSNLVEIHVTSGVVTAVTASRDTNYNYTTRRIPIETAKKEAAPQPKAEEQEPVEEVEQDVGG